MATHDADLVVVGAGPAGLSAAIEAARAGLDVIVVDENARPGGQIFRQVPEAFSITHPASLGSEFARGQALFNELKGLRIQFLLKATVWGSFEERTLEVAQCDRAMQLRARAIVIAAGAYDRPVPLPGWTLPGVFTVGGAQTILKSQRIVPGRRILMAGTGPLQLVVASQLAKAGAEIVAVADPVPTRHVLRHTAALLRAWAITRDGIRYRWNLLKARVPWITPSVLVRIEGHEEVERATIARVDAEWRPIAGTEQTFDVDTVCIGYGLVPSIELPRLLGCGVEFEEPAAVWVPRRSADFETTVSGVYSVGDGAGVAGAAVAAEEGRIAGIAAAHAQGRLTSADATSRMAPIRARLQSLAAFRAAMDALYRIRPGLHELATPTTIICRCEERTSGELEDAAREGARTLDHLKAWTRCGMGSCNARMCELPTAHLLSRETSVAVSELGLYRARPPLKPVLVEALVSDQ